MNFIDLTDQWFGPWRVIMREADAYGQTRWRLAHEYFVGLTVVRDSKNLRRGYIPRLPWHPLERRVSNIVQRCFNSKNTNYSHYGAEGIRVYEPWLRYGSGGLSYFLLEELGELPGGGYHIDRINPELGYQPGNIQWLSAGENTAKALVPNCWDPDLLIQQWIKAVSKQLLSLYLQTL